MSNLSDVQTRVRAWLKDQTEARRDLERRRVQGYRAGYKSSGDPRPVPVYPGPPAPGAIKTGVTTSIGIGTGGVITVGLAAPSNHCSFTNILIYEIVAGRPEILGEDAALFAHDQGTGEPEVLILFPTIGFFFVAGYYFVGKLPLSQLRLEMFATVAAREYHIDTVWEENR